MIFLSISFSALRRATYSSVTSCMTQAMVKLGELNSRMKDFFDVTQLANAYDFVGERLGEAIKQTFSRRQTDVESQPFCFTTDFAQDRTKQTQWEAFIRRSALTKAPSEFARIAQEVKIFLQPPASAVRNGGALSSTVACRDGVEGAMTNANPPHGK